MGSVAAQGQLPLFTLPNVRRDCEMRLAALFRDICYQDSLEGCHAGNAWLSRQVGTSADHVRALLRRLVECNLIEIRIDQGNHRRIIPLVPLAVAMRSGWKALCWAVLGRDEFPSPLRRLAEFLTTRKNKKADLAKLGITQEEVNSKPTGKAKKAPEVFGNSSPKSSGLPNKGNPQETATNTASPQSAQLAKDPTPTKPEAQVDPAAVLLLTQSGAFQEPEARSLATHFARIGASVPSISHAVQVMLRQAEKVSRPGGFLRRAVEAAVAGNPYLLPTPAAAHASDRGERPQRPVVRAPKPENVKLSKPPEPTLPHTQSAWERLDEAARQELLAIAQPRVETTLPALAPQIRRGGRDGGPHVLVLKLAQQLAEEKDHV